MSDIMRGTEQVESIEQIESIRRLREIRENGTNVRRGGVEDADSVLPMGFHHNNMVTCSDGFSVSITAGWGVKSIPNPGWAGVPESYAGPYDNFEVGRPSQLPEPWGLWKLFCSNEQDPLLAKYYYVPYIMVEQLLLDHEGFTPEGFPLHWSTNPPPGPERTSTESFGFTDNLREPMNLESGSPLGVESESTRFAPALANTHDMSPPRPGGGLGRFYHAPPTTSLSVG